MRDVLPNSPARVVLGLLLVLHAGLLCWSAARHSPTLNEPGHLAAGISHWQFGRFELYRVNPPLVRMVAALPVLAAGVETDWSRFYEGPGARPVFAIGEDLIAANGPRSLWLFAIARWACIPFSLVGAVVCFLWARDLYGVRAGLVAAALWCFSPNILGHASLITADAPAGALGLAACYTFWRWLVHPTWSRMLVAGAVLGAAELTKTTLLVFYPLAPLLWIAYRWPDRPPPRQWGREAAMLLGRVVVAIYIVNLGYGFEGSMRPLGQFTFVSRLLNGEDERPMGNRWAGGVLGALPVPLPKNYVLGIDIQRKDFEHYNRPSYLGGAFREKGWWYYYLYGLAIKVPLGTWGLMALVVWGRFFVARRGPERVEPAADARSESIPAGAKHARSRDARRPTAQLRPGARPRDEGMLLLPALALLALVSSQTGFSEHVRYALPVLPFLFVWISQAASEGFTWGHGGAAGPARDRSSTSPSARFCASRAAAWLTAGLFGWSVASSLAIYPHSLAYFNALAGGPEGGPRHLLSSNIDWGQDLIYLREWVEHHPGAGPLRLAYFGFFDPADIGLAFSAPAPASGLSDPPVDPPGVYAISVNFLYGYPWFLADGRGGRTWCGPGGLSRFRSAQRIGRAGYSIYLFRVPPAGPRRSAARGATHEKSRGKAAFRRAAFEERCRSAGHAVG